MIIIVLLDLLRIKYFRTLRTTCNLVATPRTRKQYIEFCSHSKIVNDAHVTESTRSNNLKIRLKVLKNANVSTSEQVIPYTERCVKKQLEKGTLNLAGFNFFFF